MREYLREGKDLVKMRKWCIRKHEEEWSGDRIAAHLGIPRSTAYYWITKYNGCSIEEMKDRPRRIAMEIDEHTRKFVIRLREKNNWGPCRIESYIRRVRPEGVQPISHNLIYRILVEEGMNQPLDFVRKTWGKRRFERMHSNSLWQADFKLAENDEWMLTFMDDHSRFVTGARIEHDATTEFALKLFKKCTRKYGFPKQVLTDQGPQFYCAEKEGKEHGESQFTQALWELGVQHIVASKRRPTTIGKVERFHRTYEEEAWRYRTLEAFLRYYNYQRIHQALGYQTPAEVYFRDLSRNV
jgi:transposase InsO family protein